MAKLMIIFCRCIQAAHAWLMASLVLCLGACALMAGAARAAPPVVPLASEPLTVACRAADGAGSTGNTGGAGSTGRVAGATAYFPAPRGDASAGTWLAASVGQRDWSGYFARYVLPPDVAVGGATGAIVAPLWEAGQVLTGDSTHPPQPAPDARYIYTAQIDRSGAMLGQPFIWSALSPAQQKLLDKRGPAARQPDGLGERRLDYLRGVRSDEGRPFRRRQSLLGDALHSTPVLVAAPSDTLQDEAYAAFRQRYAHRRALVYLGANDGMLHAFDLADGVERYAYVPNALMPYLSLLSDPAYVHRAYVDGPMVAGEVKLAQGWRSVLLASFGAGAQGLFALDVTDPEALDAGSALWEFTDADDPMAGNILSPPQLARVQGHAGSELAVAVVASGINNYSADGHASSAGKGALFLLALDKPRAQGWRLNSNYFRLITPITDPVLANGLGAPALLADRAGLLRFAYAGDMQGNLWRFDLHGAPPWTGSAERLFTARDQQGRRQPITAQPSIVYDADGAYLILFGTGRLLNRDDLTASSFGTQTFYALRDSLERPVSVISGRQQLMERQLFPTQQGLFDVSGGRAEAGSRGWYIDFWQSERTGERSIDSASVVDGTVVFTTLVPGATACSASHSRSYALNALTGLPASSELVLNPAVAEVGLMQPDYAGKPVLLPAARQADVPGPAASFRRTRVLTQLAPVINTSGALNLAALARIKVVRRAGRLSWREVNNWRELHEAAK
ncbi:pilus assembly protein [Pseudoduganella danionis]|uniref:pilus assembly protein n=1 Tax=Pseudoduganella danionis TaxID=1890295 RepID=UPI0035B0AF73